jgi:hypothetical protein
VLGGAVLGRAVLGGAVLGGVVLLPIWTPQAVRLRSNLQKDVEVEADDETHQVGKQHRIHVLLEELAAPDKKAEAYGVGCPRG